MRELAQTLKGAKVVDGCSGVKISTLGADIGSWDPTDKRVDIATYGLEEDRL